MKCPKCGKELYIDAVQCPDCKYVIPVTAEDIEASNWAKNDPDDVQSPEDATVDMAFGPDHDYPQWFKVHCRSNCWFIQEIDNF